MIQNPAKLRLSKRQLLLINEDGETTLPLEDIAVIILESPQISLSSALLAFCQDNNVAIITCDSRHMPNGMLLPFLPHSRNTQVAHIQQSWSKPLRKRLWKNLVQQKIYNQAECLKRAYKAEASKRLVQIAALVRPGDPENREAQAARIYWPVLFEHDFRRNPVKEVITSEKNVAINAALNYGYAVLRAFVARSQVSYGLIPAFGIHHNNQLNAFNLTDDVMEVFRPFIDFLTFQMQQENKFIVDNLPKDVRQKFAHIGTFLCKIENKTHTLMNACEKIAARLVSAIKNKNSSILTMPLFV